MRRRAAVLPSPALTPVAGPFLAGWLVVRGRRRLGRSWAGSQAVAPGTPLARPGLHRPLVLGVALPSRWTLAALLVASCSTVPAGVPSCAAVASDLWRDLGGGESHGPVCRPMTATPEGAAHLLEGVIVPPCPSSPVRSLDENPCSAPAGRPPSGLLQCGAGRRTLLCCGGVGFVEGFGWRRKPWTRLRADDDDALGRPSPC